MRATGSNPNFEHIKHTDPFHSIKLHFAPYLIFLFFINHIITKNGRSEGHFWAFRTLHFKTNTMKYFLLLLGWLLAQICNGQTGTDVIINSNKLTPAQINEIHRTYGIAPIPGNYWYDPRSGMYGHQGGPVIGVMYPGHSFGILLVDASQGSSGVYINNRELQTREATQLAHIFGYYQAIPGRYWMNPNGDLGVEGFPYAIGNVYMAIAIAQRNQVGSNTRSGNLWSSGLYSGGNYYTGANGQPSQGYVSVPGYGPVSHGMN